MGEQRKRKWSVFDVRGRAALAFGVLALSFWFTPETLPALGGCSFRGLTGWDCPGCGLSRAFTSISHGSFGAAWSYNPFAFVLYPLAVGGVLAPFLRTKKRARAFGRWFVWSSVAILIAFAIFGIVRNLN